MILRAKVLLLGDPQVGKSALVQSFLSDGSVFAQNYQMTIGMDLSIKSVKINTDDQEDQEGNTKDATVELYLHDIAGQDIYREMISKFWENADMFVIMYDVTNKDSFESCETWIKMLKAELPDRPLLGVLVGNKIENQDNRQVTEEEAQKWAQKHDMMSFETSVSESTNIEAPFDFLGEQFYSKYQANMEQYQQQIA
eukprot:TRINITY_DN666_c0_g1_i3.p1 TRINITY_DN666_c0_g1~~TRINITY_DN666_c0_g1_i3.p1  ORF type:complete len:197 (+),score=55.23 TRINITY_DN666_c0_g1_i3:902-1492(+)